MEQVSAIRVLQTRLTVVTSAHLQWDCLQSLLNSEIKQTVPTHIAAELQRYVTTQNINGICS
jgi:hypothetical protein